MPVASPVIDPAEARYRELVESGRGLMCTHDLAGTLLSDTRLYRLAAQDHGLSDIAHVMGDLETVLLEASMTRQPDAAALERVQNLIRKRDLVVKMQVVSSSGI
jgi:hypothetical protein